MAKKKFDWDNVGYDVDDKKEEPKTESPIIENPSEKKESPKQKNNKPSSSEPKNKKINDAPKRKEEEEKSKGRVTIGVSLPKEEHHLAEIAAGFKFKGKMSAYISSLIKKDIEENGEKYKQLEELLSKK